MVYSPGCGRGVYPGCGRGIPRRGEKEGITVRIASLSPCFKPVSKPVLTLSLSSGVFLRKEKTVKTPLFRVSEKRVKPPLFQVLRKEESLRRGLSFLPTNGILPKNDPSSIQSFYFSPERERLFGAWSTFSTILNDRMAGKDDHSAHPLIPKVIQGVETLRLSDLCY